MGEGYGSRVKRFRGLRDGDSWMIYMSGNAVRRGGHIQRAQHTCTVPVIEALAARISPQYLSLHQERHHPPSASRCGLGPTLVNDCCDCNGCPGIGGVFSREGNAWVGVLSGMALESGPWMDGRDNMSISSVSCHDVRTGCSRHS